MKELFFFLCIVCLVSCRESGYDAHETLSSHEYNETLQMLAPYVIAKADEFTFEQRFDTANRAFYQNFIKVSEGQLRYYKALDTASVFCFAYRDHTSLYEHYRAIGGYYKKTNGKVSFLNLRYHTPRLTKKELEIRGKMLFEEMMKTGGVAKFFGKREFIQTPNSDFYYNTKLNRWDYTENSSWKFLYEAKQRAED